jgi:hypothetical protein
MSSVRSFVAVVASLALAAVSASAQPIISAKSGVIAGVEGKVLLNNEEVQQSVTHFPEVKENAVLSTEDGRVELMLPPGFMLRMGENGSLKMLANRLIDTRLELQKGSSVVEVDQVNQDYNVNIALKDGMVTLSKVGVYRFDTEPARLKVFHGMATVQMGGQSVMVATGKMVNLSGAAAAVDKFDVEQADALDNWSRRRAEAMALANISGAKYANDNPTPANGTGSRWSYNPYFDMYTYIPYSGTMCNPYYSLCYFSPMAAYQNFYMYPGMTNYYPGGTRAASTTPAFAPASGASSALGSPMTSAGGARSPGGTGVASGLGSASVGSGASAASAASASGGHASAAGGAAAGHK